MVPTPLDTIAKPRPADPGRGFDVSPTRNLHPLHIPTPVMHIAGTCYAVALAEALRHAYELNGAPNRAFERDDAERAWLAVRTFSEVCCAIRTIHFRKLRRI
jgi:hypothetical protein